MMAVTSGLGPGSLKTRCSNEGRVGMDIAVVLMVCRCSVAIPSPRPSCRGLSR